MRISTQYLVIGCLYIKVWMMVYLLQVADSDLYVSAPFPRPWDKMVVRFRNHFSCPCGPQFGLKIRWGPWAPWYPSPRSPTVYHPLRKWILYEFSIQYVVKILWTAKPWTATKSILFNQMALLALHMSWLQQSIWQFQPISLHCFSEQYFAEAQYLA